MVSHHLDIFDLFEEQHAHITTQLQNLAEAAEHLLIPQSGERLKRITEAFAGLEEGIRNHSDAEDRVLLPLLEEHIFSQGPLERMRREHNRIHELLHELDRELAAMATLHPINQVKLEGVATTAKMLVAILQDHIDFEMSQIFPIAREVLSHDQRAQVSAELAESQAGKT